MGIFDNRLISPFIPSAFKPNNKRDSLGDRYIMEQQPGCGVRVYPNNENRSPLNLYWEIESCSVDRTTTDMGGSFTITLLPTAPWDEILEADDFVRIFMGDQVMQGFLGKAGYNFADSIDQNQSRARVDSVFVPLTDASWSRDTETGQVHYLNNRKVNYLVMYERLVGKIDRVQRVENAQGGADGGQNIRYVVSGRSIGAIVQDISLYYNEFLPGLNAINIFFGSNISLFNSPEKFVLEVLSVVLSAVPLPQWQLPKSLMDDLNYGPVRTENLATAKKNLGTFKKSIEETIKQNPTSGLKNALTELNKLMSEIGSSGDKNPFNVLSVKSFKPTFGNTFNKSFLESTTTGLFDLLKHLSNDAWNELFFDMCPGGNIDGGDAENNVAIPSIVMRQRPYDITPEMLESVATYVEPYADKLTKFPRASIETPAFSELKNISKSLFELQQNSITIYARNQDSNVSKYLDSISKVFSSNPGILAPGVGYLPTVIQNETGRSNHDRLNAWLVTANYNRGTGIQTDRAMMAENGGFKVDIDSIRKYGFRIMELSTIYGQPDDSPNQPQDYGVKLKAFNAMLANWYFMNPAFLNGRIVCRFLPEARLGIPVKYFETKVSPENPYPKMDLFYCQGVTDQYTYGSPITTTLTVIRGIRYNLSLADGAGMKAEIAKLSTVRERVKGFFSSFGGGIV